MVETEARFPPKLDFLFKPGRYKVAYGGRGGAKSWGYARALLIQAAHKRLRILCAREIQKSIRDSVHQLLSDQIESLQLQGFTILRDELRHANGSQFLFCGLSDLTAESIKSFEGVDIVWVEEARTVTKRSWSILIPTIRKADSEIWITFNPELDTDDTYVRFVSNPPPGSFVAKLTWRDNPWFSKELEAERLHSETTDPDEYDNVWEGNCRSAVQGAIYAKEIAKMDQEGRVCNAPYDPMLKVHVVADLGFNDQMSIGLVQRSLSEVRIIEYIEDSHRTLDDYSAELKDKRMNWGKFYLPHDARHKTLASAGQSVEQIVKTLGWETEIVPDIGVEPGIKMARMVFARTYMDREKTARLRECLKRYRRTIPKTTGEPGAPIHDEFSHGADMFRYLSISADKMRNESAFKSGKIAYDNRGII